ncbi:L-arabinose isomerase [Paenibacillus rhizovicinus]|uniref:L-arabinose isomerase n=1 Tax=Paenibacillus rhizovicinus TaxID=2704463 RepID=A0A6C0NZW4_9BACL|nr:L-arabinose isomerase [Paenibacillus rhizovicinus]QHW31193.1 L-arabinose isomerase [Paenibacillus rhizovicinus]
MLNVKPYEFWFLTGSQHLYGAETLLEVEAHSQEMVDGLNSDSSISYKIVFKALLTTPEDIRKTLIEASSSEACAGVITWMHTFSPSKMWISGLAQLNKPHLHFATQYNREIPWSTIDMDFMNTNQAAHGDREHGFIATRMGRSRKVVFGHWADQTVRAQIGGWQRTAVAYCESKTLKVARFGDNMRQVAVTEGDKVEAEIRFGWSVNTYGVGDLAERVSAVAQGAVDELVAEYEQAYTLVADTAEKRQAIAYQARLELAIRGFLEEGGFTAFTTTFEDLHGLEQLPGLAVQRLMADGYGFGGEGDWKTAALVRLMKIMADGKGTSFMEDYTYHLEPGNELVLGAHMLEICPTIAAGKPRIEVHPLGIGGKADPARMVFNGRSGSAINASIVDLGHRFRLLVNQVNAVEVAEAMPNLPVARVLWQVLPNLKDGVEAWILAGGAHHTGFSYEVTTEQMLDFAEMFGIESVLIDERTDRISFPNQLRLNQAAWNNK